MQMSLLREQEVFIISNVEKICHLFDVNEERHLLAQYFPSNEINEWLKTGSNRYDQTRSFCLGWIKKRNQEFYHILADFFLRRSEEYKSMHTKMMNIGETSSDYSQTLFTAGDFQLEIPTENLSIKNQIDELQRNVINELRKMQSAAISSERSLFHNEDTEDIVHKLRERVKELEEERLRWFSFTNGQCSVTTNEQNLKIPDISVRKNPETINGQEKRPIYEHNLKTSITRVDKHDIYNAETDTPLHKAARNGNHQLVEEILRQSPELVNDKDNAVSNLLQLAMNGLHWSVIEILMKYNCSVDVKNDYSQSLLELASIYGKHEIVEEILRQSPELVNYKDIAGTNLIQMAMNGPHWGVIEILMKYNCSIDVKNRNERTLRQLASQYGKHGLVEKILKISSASINEKSACDGRTALHYAASSTNQKTFEDSSNVSECGKSSLKKNSILIKKRR